MANADPNPRLTPELEASSATVRSGWPRGGRPGRTRAAARHGAGRVRGPGRRRGRAHRGVPGRREHGSGPRLRSNGSSLTSPQRQARLRLAKSLRRHASRGMAAGPARPAAPVAGAPSAGSRPGWLSPRPWSCRWPATSGSCHDAQVQPAPTGSCARPHPLSAALAPLGSLKRTPTSHAVSVSATNGRRPKLASRALEGAARRSRSERLRSSWPRARCGPVDRPSGSRCRAMRCSYACDWSCPATTIRPIERSF